MSAYKLVQKFEDRADFPVRLDEVRDAVVQLGGSDVIQFKSVDIDKDTLKGICYRYRPIAQPYAREEEWVDIIYAESLSEEWRRIVVTKELIHVLDKDGHRITTDHQLDDLVRRMARRPELRDGFSAAETSDRVGLFQALGILFPFEARRLIKPKYDLGHISDEMIAHRAAIPLSFVPFVMSDEWADTYDFLMKLCEGLPAAAE
ncbi:hypothetical protein ACFPIF_11685 [Brevundimonas faecalis]|uniref:hypothetical protein n=1 Tax=Brevundimonas faecalis TaxID=947378 RepID=UPI00361A85E6